jgi:DNA-binding response OmpR family regulator
MNILIVEDEERLAEALAQIMKSQKYKVDVVHDGLDGLDFAMSGAYDVVVLDVMLPGKNGFDLVRQLRGAKTPRLSSC